MGSVDGPKSQTRTIQGHGLACCLGGELGGCFWACGVYGGACSGQAGGDDVEDEEDGERGYKARQLESVSHSRGGRRESPQKQPVSRPVTL